MVGPSLYALPIAHINLGGEMVYILNQRLTAQKIPEERAKRVMNEVISTMFSAKLLDELFRPQPLYSNSSMRTVFDRLAHSSIMRLNQNSMDKLYDLMTMGFKWQLMGTRCPMESVIHVTLNHLESMRTLVPGSPAACNLLDSAIARIGDVYGDMRISDLASVRLTLLDFLQDRRVRVTLFLEEKVQRRDGMFVLEPGALPQHIEVPGLIRRWNDGGNVGKGSRPAPNSTGNFPTPCSAMQSTEPPLSALSKDTRVTKLGLNMYLKARSRDRKKGKSSRKDAHRDDHRDEPKGEQERKPYIATVEQGRKATAGVNMLADIMAQHGTGSAETDSDYFEINLFGGVAADDDDPDEFVFAADAKESASAAAYEEEGRTVVFNARKDTSGGLRGMMEDLSVTGAAVERDQEEEDLLDLID